MIKSKIKNNRGLMLFILCWMAYFSTYLCRLNFSAAMPEMDKLAVLSKSQMGNITSLFFIAYGIGQLFSGILGDKFPPKYLIFGGLILSGLTNLIIYFVPTYSVMSVVWCINGFVQAFIWSPILRIAGDYYDEKGGERFGINMSTTVPLGTLFAYLLSLGAIALFGWKEVFLISGAIVVLISFVWLIGSDLTLRKMDKVLKKSNDGDNEIETSGKPIKIKKLIGLFAVTGIFVVMLPIAIHGALKDSVTTWVPTFITDNFDVVTGFSIALTMILPVVNVTGAYIAKFINKFIRNEMITSAVFFAVASVALAILLGCGRVNVWLTLVMLAIITNCMFGVNVMMITIVPLKFAGCNRTSTVSGILNAVAYIGCGIANVAAGYLLDGGGWSVLIAVWLGMSILGTLTYLVIARIWKRKSKLLI